MMKDLTPQQIVRELDRYIVGQNAAKRSVAIAMRNRYRRLQLPADLQSEITPKNILMIGPTGVGKTEIARRLAKMADAPFIKVEATKFTQVGYVGRDVESIIRDLMETAVGLVHEERVSAVRERAAQAAEKKILDILTARVAVDDMADVTVSTYLLARRQHHILRRADHVVGLAEQQQRHAKRCPGAPPQTNTQVRGRATGPQRAGRANDRDRA